MWGKPWLLNNKMKLVNEISSLFVDGYSSSMILEGRLNDLLVINQAYRHTRVSLYYTHLRIVIPTRRKDSLL